MTNISILLRNLRTTKGLKQSEIAQALGISLSTYSHYECGSRLPDTGMLIKFSLYYKINISYLLFVMCMDISEKGLVPEEQIFQVFTFGNILEKDEQQLLSHYRMLPLPDKINICDFMEAILNGLEEPS